MYEIKSLSIPLSVFLTSSLVRLFNCDFHFEHFWAKLNIWNVFISQDCFSSCPVLTHTRRWISGQCPLMSHLRRYVDIINWLFNLKWDYTTSFFCKPYFLLLLRKQSNKNHSPKHSSTFFFISIKLPSSGTSVIFVLALCYYYYYFLILFFNCLHLKSS